MVVKVMLYKAYDSTNEDYDEEDADGIRYVGPDYEWDADDYNGDYNDYNGIIDRYDDDGDDDDDDDDDDDGEEEKEEEVEEEEENVNHDDYDDDDDDDDDGFMMCVICLGAKATMQTFPCGHRVVCRKCFIKTIQVAVSQRCLPLRCVICRTRILKLRQNPKPHSDKREASDKIRNGLRKESKKTKVK
uniref:RING-type domain-containing protein n=1 Tax=Octopus bimaculoides TaxID=37653 RepID=A0A0L8I6T5_OCTBM